MASIENQKESSQMACDLGIASYRRGELDKALRLLHKSKRIYPLPDIDTWITTVETATSAGTPSSSSSSDPPSSSSPKMDTTHLPEDLSAKYTGGLTIGREMHMLCERGQRNYLSVPQGGQRLRDLYREEVDNLDPNKFSPLGLSCFVGNLDRVKSLILSRTYNPAGYETAFHWGWHMMTVAGAMQVSGPSKHKEVIEFLLKEKIPTEVQDICGYTALHFAIGSNGRPELGRALLLGGANINHRTIYGSVVAQDCLMSGDLHALEVALEASPDLAIPDADGLSPIQMYMGCGGPVTTMVDKFLRKVAGSDPMPRSEKVCGHCGRSGEGVQLNACSRCKLTLYCSRECQKKDWPTHKATCQRSVTLMVRPFYHEASTTWSPADAKRGNLKFYDADPNFEGKDKAMVIKIQVGLLDQVGRSDMMVYNKKRDFQCMIRRADDAAVFDTIFKLIKEKGMGGLKAFFMATLHSKDSLEIVSEVIAPQPW
eukprot:TRINITY_DN16039_c0_g1_i2.p1 TRINITY_DN16039_c0_g1~~TRINITY_DN16039_c0_g1_i2.p1  ORF type:complete len:484 (+),score=114.10 TRINITY_DN16039_c0_g1_i2:80-1531(+)